MKAAADNFLSAVVKGTGCLVKKNNGGQAYGSKGENKEALADFDKAIELDPDYALAYSDRGRIYYILGEFERAGHDLHKAIDLGYPVDESLLKAVKEKTSK